MWPLLACIIAGRNAFAVWKRELANVRQCDSASVERHRLSSLRRARYRSKKSKKIENTRVLYREAYLIYETFRSWLLVILKSVQQSNASNSNIEILQIFRNHSQRTLVRHAPMTLYIMILMYYT